MSALTFRINAETDKLNSFVASLERLKRVLMDIPSGTKEFDEISKRISQVEAQMEKAMANIAKCQQQIDDAAAKSATAVAASASKEATQAVSAEAVAYHELLEELRAVSASKRENVELIQEYSAKSKEAAAHIQSLNKMEKDGYILTESQRASRSRATSEYEEYKISISQARRELANQIKYEQAARGSIDEMAQALGRMRAVYRQLNETDRQSEFGQKLLANIQALDQKVKELDFSMGNHQRNVGNYSGSFDHLSFSIQQVARELPAIAYGPQVFFGAISNNLPILSDALAQTRKEIAAAKKAGAEFVPMWKQLASSIVSWQTLLVAGITVLTLYGDEIVTWVGELIKGKKAFDAAAQSAEDFHEAMIKGAADAQREVINIRLLYGASQDLATSYEDRLRAARKLQEEYPAYFGNMSTEKILAGELKDEYENLIATLIRVSQARAAQDKMTELAEIRVAAEMSEEFLSVQDKERENYEKINKLQAALNAKIKEKNKVQEAGAIGVGFNAQIDALENRIKYLKDFTKDLSEDAFKDWLDGDGSGFEWIKDKGIKTFTELFDYIDKSSTQLGKKVQESLTTITPDEENEEAERKAEEEKRRQENIARLTEQNRIKLNAELQKLARDAQDAELDLMDEGIDKKLAKLDLQYQREIDLIKQREAEIKALQGGSLSEDQQRMFQFQRKKAEKDNLSRTDEAFANEIGGLGDPQKDRQEWNEYLIAYGNYREKLQAVKDKYDLKMSQATSGGEKAMLEAQMAEELGALEVEASTFAEDLQVLMIGELEKMLANTEKLLSDAETQFQSLDSSSGEDGDALRKQIAMLKAKIKKLEAEIKAKEGKQDEKDDWKEVQEILIELSDQFKQLGEDIGGVAGESIAAAGTVASSAIQMVSGITALADGGIAAIKNASGAASKAMAAMEAASVILTVISSAIQITQQLMQLFGADYSDYEELKAYYDDLNDVWDKLIEKKKDYIEMSYGQESKQVAEEAISLVEKQVESYKALGKELLNSGASAGSHSIGVRQIKKMGEKEIADLKKVASEMGFDAGEILTGRMTALFDLTADQLQALMEGAPTLWAKLNDEVRGYLESIIAGEEEIEEIRNQLNQQLTQVSFDQVFDNFVDTLMDMDASAEDFANQFSEYMMRAMLTNKIGDVYQKQLETWYNDFAKANEDGMTDSEISELRSRWNQMVNEVIVLRDQIASTTGYDEMKTKDSQTATARGFQAMDQETGSELNGRFTDIQGKITDIRDYSMTQTEAILSIIGELSMIKGSIDYHMNVSDELLRYAVMSYMEIVEIKSDTSTMRAALLAIQESIAAVKKNTDSLVS